MASLLTTKHTMQTSDQFKFGGLDKTPVNVLRLLSELEGSYQLLKYMGFQEDMETLDKMKKKYYSIYFRLNREEKIKDECPSG